MCTCKQFCRLRNSRAVCNEIIVRRKIFTHCTTIRYLFITGERIHIILQVAGKNPLLVGQIIVLQVFDDIHIPILYNICISICIVFYIYLHKKAPFKEAFLSTIILDCRVIVSFALLNHYIHLHYYTDQAVVLDHLLLQHSQNRRNFYKKLFRLHS